jgi:predicted enzyme related to lactoylglutathione lyase
MIDTGGFPKGGMWRIPQDKPIGVITYVLVDNIDAIMEKVKELGGKEILSKRKTDGDAYAVFADQEGNILGLWEPSKKSQE